MLDFGDNLRVQEAEREETDLSRLDCLFRTVRGRHCRRGASADGERVLVGLYQRVGEWGIKCNFSAMCKPGVHLSWSCLSRQLYL